MPILDGRNTRLHEDGTTWTKVVKWFGYKLHLVVDSTYELPVAWEVTKASVSDVTRAMPMLDHLHHRHGGAAVPCRLF